LTAFRTGFRKNHRLIEKVSEKLHQAYKKATPEVRMAQIAVLKPKELQPAELLSTASYKPGEMIDIEHYRQKLPAFLSGRKRLRAA